MYQLNVSAHQVLVRGNQFQTIELGFYDGIGKSCVTEQNVVKCWFAVIFSNSKPGGGISLWVGINNKDAQFASCKGRSQVDGSCGLAHTALLIGDGDYSSQFRLCYHSCFTWNESSNPQKTLLAPREPDGLVPRETAGLRYGSSSQERYSR